MRMIILLIIYKRFVINSTASYNGSDYSLYSSTHDIKNVENDNDLLHWLLHAE